MRRPRSFLRAWAKRQLLSDKGVWVREGRTELTELYQLSCKENFEKILAFWAWVNA